MGIIKFLYHIDLFCRQLIDCLHFYANNLENVRAIIAPVIEDYKSGKITYAEAEFNARTRIYQSVKPDFNPNVEYMKDPLSRDIPSVDNSLFILARKLILASK